MRKLFAEQLAPDKEWPDGHWEKELSDIARIDWLCAEPHYNILHGAKTARWDIDGWCGRDVIMFCGFRTAEAHIPGMFSRIATRRCARCCDKLGMPRGVGSPKNNPACRPYVGLETK